MERQKSDHIKRLITLDIVSLIGYTLYLQREVIFFEKKFCIIPKSYCFHSFSKRFCSSSYVQVFKQDKPCANFVQIMQIRRYITVDKFNLG